MNKNGKTEWSKLSAVYFTCAMISFLGFATCNLLSGMTALSYGLFTMSLIAILLITQLHGGKKYVRSMGTIKRR